MKARLEFTQKDFEFLLPEQQKEFERAILEFDLLEDDSEFQIAVNANKYYCALWEIKDFIRSQLKYGITETDEKLLEYVQSIVLNVLAV